MKKTITLVIILCFMMTILFCACGNDTQAPDASAEGQQTEQTQPADQSSDQKEMEVSLTTIEGWNPVEGSAAIIQYLKEGSSVIVTCDAMPPEADTPDKFIEYVKGKLNETFDNISFGDASEIGISENGKSFLVYTYDVSAGGTAYKMKAWGAYLFHEDKAYTLTCGALADSFPEEDFQTFIESFKLVPKE